MMDDWLCKIYLLLRHLLIVERYAHIIILKIRARNWMSNE